MKSSEKDSTNSDAGNVEIRQDNTMKQPVKLGPRLQTIAACVPVGARVGDIGTDHAYLPLYLLQNGIIREAVGVDVHKGPYESALDNVRVYGLQDAIRIRLGNGLIPLEPDEVDTLVIAGMGGVTILEILAGKSAVLENIQTLILQPQGAESRVRYELLSQGWKLKQEFLVEEDDRIYTVLHFSRSEGLNITEVKRRISETIQDILAKSAEKFEVMEADKTEYERIVMQLIWQIGPLIVEQKDALIRSIIAETSTNLQRVILEMMRTDRAQVTAKAMQMKKEIAMLEVMETWLYQ